MHNTIFYLFVCWFGFSSGFYVFFSVGCFYHYWFSRLLVVVEVIMATLYGTSHNLVVVALINILLLH